MDTREKIIPLSEVADLTSQGSWLIIDGFFDPLTPATASFLSQSASAHPERRLLILIDPAPGHLRAADRAPLVAALRCVSQVAIGTIADLPALGGQVKITTDSAADRQRSRDFVQRVLSRQEAGVQ